MKSDPCRRALILHRCTCAAFILLLYNLLLSCISCNIYHTLLKRNRVIIVYIYIFKGSYLHTSLFLDHFCRWFSRGIFSFLLHFNFMKCCSNLSAYCRLRQANVSVVFFIFKTVLSLRVTSINLLLHLFISVFQI